ncbi:MAG: ABC transporter substrate-binding protein [Paenibacillus dendritiformis]|uniref:ABC transporter substrate-binding protein n=1 Tax=uncultured Paenibacillus sp. TaxID=227322 RepID=UPI0025E2A306|nr:ABC transporter substrate-binding protein [uncultured Paenibacillus sp.]MDU5145622.1 ABC transporter substrate-binding protein [Paenibacillus dendritiformis]
MRSLHSQYLQQLIYYHTLCMMLPQGGQRDGIPVTLEELAELLHCSVRNVRFVIKKMEQAGWIAWTSGWGRGRGRRSSIALLASADELLISGLKAALGRGNWKGAMELLQLPGVSGETKAFVADWMSGMFGYEEVRDNGTKWDALRFPVFRTITTLDPLEALYAIDEHLVRQIFDTFVRYDAKQRCIVPHIAHHWVENDDYTVWTFYLRKRVRFHNHTELTARDAVFTLRRMRGRIDASPSGWLAAHIEAMRIIDPYVLQVRLAVPNAMLLWFLASRGAAMVPENHYGGEHGAGLSVPVGTGPYRVRHADEYHCRLEAFDDYFLGRAHLDRIDIRVLPEDMSAMQEYGGSGGHVLISHQQPIEAPSAEWRKEHRLA